MPPAIPNFSSQSDRANNANHCLSIYFNRLNNTADALMGNFESLARVLCLKSNMASQKLLSALTSTAKGPCVTWPTLALESFAIDFTYLVACTPIKADYHIAVTTFVVTIATFQTFLQDINKIRLVKKRHYLS